MPLRSRQLDRRGKNVGRARRGKCSRISVSAEGHQKAAIAAGSTVPRRVRRKKVGRSLPAAGLRQELGRVRAVPTWTGVRTTAAEERRRSGGASVAPRLLVPTARTGEGDSTVTPNARTDEGDSTVTLNVSGVAPRLSVAMADVPAQERRTGRLIAIGRVVMTTGPSPSAVHKARRDRGGQSPAGTIADVTTNNGAISVPGLAVGVRTITVAATRAGTTMVAVASAGTMAATGGREGQATTTRPSQMATYAKIAAMPEHPSQMATCVKIAATSEDPNVHPGGFLVVAQLRDVVSADVRRDADPNARPAGHVGRRAAAHPEVAGQVCHAAPDHAGSATTNNAQHSASASQDA